MDAHAPRCYVVPTLSVLLKMGLEASKAHITLQLDTRVMGQVALLALQLKQILNSHSTGREAV